MDKELFELCKDVYERTKWGRMDNGSGPTDFYYRKGWYKDKFQWVEEHYSISQSAGLMHVSLDKERAVPLYTSDYLLEKLPFFHEYWNGGNEAGYLSVKHWAVQSEAGYWEENGERNPENKFTSGYADTPLKALLKLTLALYEAGELK